MSKQQRSDVEEGGDSHSPPQERLKEAREVSLSPPEDFPEREVASRETSMVLMDPKLAPPRYTAPPSGGLKRIERKAPLVLSGRRALPDPTIVPPWAAKLKEAGFTLHWADLDEAERLVKVTGAYGYVHVKDPLLKGIVPRSAFDETGYVRRKDGVPINYALYTLTDNVVAAQESAVAAFQARSGDWQQPLGEVQGDVKVTEGAPPNGPRPEGQVVRDADGREVGDTRTFAARDVHGNRVESASAFE